METVLLGVHGDSRWCHTPLISKATTIDVEVTEMLTSADAYMGPKSKETRAQLISVKPYAWAVGIIWSLVVAGSLLWAWYQTRQRTLEVAERYRDVCGAGAHWQTEQIDYEDDRAKGIYEVHAFQTAPGTMATMSLDVTERKRAEEVLPTSEEKYRQVVENAHEAIFIAQDGFLKFPNPRLAAITSYTPDELTFNVRCTTWNAFPQRLCTPVGRSRLQQQQVMVGKGVLDRFRDGEGRENEVAAVHMVYKSVSRKSLQ